MKIKEISLLDELDFDQIIVEWNQTQKYFPETVLLHELIEKQVEKTPEALAVVFEGQHYTYNELNIKANQLAHYLRKIGVGPDSIVAVSFDRSLEMIVVLLGILKSGGSYVPLDPDYPEERLAFILRDTQASILITHTDLNNKFTFYQGRTILIDQWDILLSEENKVNPKIICTPDHLAYIIYTSGSTGTPKGVCNVHKAIVNRIYWMQEQFGLTQTDKVLQKTSFSFDVSVWEFFWPLMAGAELHLATPGVHRNPTALIETIQESNITIIHFVPSMLKLFLQEKNVEKCDSLRIVFSSGEALECDLESLFFKKIACELYNLYGPTEAAVDVTYWRCRSNSLFEFVPIGRPIANTSIYILDKNLKPVPIGASGELHIGGVGLARGYLNRKELTDQKFIPDPFHKNTKTRLYKTGDLARYLPDGTIVYLGRLDHQVKIRGYRIELGEIEAVIKRLPEVKDAVTIVREDQILAYIISEDKSHQSLRHFLEKSLPHYMIPSSIIFLDAFPLTTSGKLDRNALPSPGIEEDSYIPPSTYIESALIKMWSNLLRKERMGIYDHFFHSGGHSLLAVQLVSQIRSQFNVDVSLKMLFETPTVVDMAKMIAQQKKSLTPEIARRDEEELPSLSYAQQRLWIADQLLSNRAIYNVPVAIRLKGSLNLIALQRACNDLMNRHEALRTTIDIVNGRPFQAIALEKNFSFDVVFADDFQKLAEEEACKPFDLKTGPLIRGKLICVGPNDHVFLITMHHIISDEWSMKILFHELSMLYSSYCSGEAIVLPKLSIQYADFAIWQKEWLQGEILNEQMAYWKSALNGIPDAIQLPIDHPKPLKYSDKGQVYCHIIDNQLLMDIKNKADNKGLSLFVMLLAAFQSLLYRYSQQEDIVVGCPIANRHYPQVENVIGFFLNTIALRTNFMGNPSFDKILEDVRIATLNAYENQDIPFESIVEALEVERQLNRHPIYQVRFFLEDPYVNHLKLESLDVTLLSLQCEHSKFELMVSAQEKEGELHVRFEYATELFEIATIKQISHYFVQILKEVVRDSSQKIDDISLLDANEKEKVLYTWNLENKKIPVNRATVQAIFEACAEEFPETIAVTFQDKMLTYRELNSQANQLAHYLQQEGVCRESLVAICLDRSLEMIIAILGVLKAGGAYVPIDPDLPKSRQDFILEDTQAKVLIQKEYFSFIQNQEKKNLSIGEHCDLAYIIYTSGSTGKPKGVMIEQDQLVYYTKAICESIPFKEYQNFAIASTFVTDLSNTLIFGALCTGKSLHIIPEECIYTAKEMSRFLKENKIDCLKLVPSHLKAILDENFPFPKICLILGGERLEWDLVRKFQNISPDSTIINHYGPTETTIGASTYLVDKKQIGASVPIGKPLPHAKLYILDNQMRPMPIGIIGDLYIGGAGLARGYYNRLDLTAEKFIHNPFGIDLEEKIYQTGDLARYLPGGFVEFIGRKDTQVKIRGYRIELEEITSVLKTHGDVKDAVIVAQNNQLISYIIPDEFSPSGTELREFLEKKLPNYMIPSAFILLDTFPLKSNGKLNIQALPLLKQNKEGISLPTTEEEKTLATIWYQLLGLEEVGIHDSFFHCGGHSLLATQLISKIRLAFNVEVSLKMIFEHPTIAGITECIKNLNDCLSYPPIEIRDKNVLPCLSFAQQRLWFIDKLSQQTAAYNIPICVLLKGNLDKDALQKSLEAIIHRHEVLRTIIHVIDGEAFQKIEPEANFLLSHIHSKDIQKIAQIEASIPFNLEKGPLVRGTLIHVDLHTHALLFTLHHIVADGWSMEIFFRELSALYESYRLNVVSSLPPLPIQYADFAVWQRNWLKTAVLERQKSYWKEALNEIPDMLQFPTDHPRKPQPSYRGKVHFQEVRQELLLKIKRKAEEKNLSLFMMMLAAFQCLLYRYSHQDDIIVGCPVSNRHYPKIEGLIGFFVNTLALRINFEGHPTFDAILESVRRVALDAYDHQDVPFEQLIDFLNIERRLNRHPVYQVRFFLDSSQAQDLKLEGLEITPILLEGCHSKFDLMVSANEQDEKLNMRFEYAVDLFENETIQKLAEQFILFLESVVVDSAQPIDQICLLDLKEKQRVLIDWNRTQKIVVEQTIHSLIQNWVKKTPEAVAVVLKDKQLTYYELNIRANQLAHYLQKLGVIQGDFVAIKLDRSLEMVIAIFAVLKIGAGYVPIDPSNPESRVQFILEDTQSKILLTEEQFALMYDEPCCDFKTLCNPSDIAYVIYTSGSTGKPKGVMIEHAALVNYVIAMDDRISFKDRHHFALASTFATDLGNTLIFGALCFGKSYTLYLKNVFILLSY